MNKQERFDWIKSHLTKPGVYSANVFDSDFVHDYIDNCKPKKWGFQPYGAPSCPQLSSDLSAMFKERILIRQSTGLGDMASLFGRKWVYDYRIVK